MRISFTTVLILTLLVACGKKSTESSPEVNRPQIGGGPTNGNPTGSTPGTTPPTTGGQTTAGSGGGGTSNGNPGEPDGNEVPSVSYFIGDKDQGREGIDSTGFSSMVDLTSATVIDFNQFKKGKTEQIDGGENIKFSFTVVNEGHLERKLNTTFEDFFGTKRYHFKVEEHIKQNGVKGKDAGIDTGIALWPTRRVVAVWNFSEPISYFGSTLIDLESSDTLHALIRTFDCQKNIIEESSIIYPDGENGNKEIHFVGVLSTHTNICSVSISVGDRPGLILTNGSRRAIAIDDFVYGVKYY